MQKPDATSYKSKLIRMHTYDYASSPDDDSIEEDIPSDMFLGKAFSRKRTMGIVSELVEEADRSAVVGTPDLDVSHAAQRNRLKTRLQRKSLLRDAQMKDNAQVRVARVTDDFNKSDHGKCLAARDHGDGKKDEPGGGGVERARREEDGTPQFLPWMVGAGGDMSSSGSDDGAVVTTVVRKKTNLKVGFKKGRAKAVRRGRNAAIVKDPKR